MRPPPRELHQWTSLSRRGRRWWLCQARDRRFSRTNWPPTPSGRTFVLPGKLITDFDSFLCAIGEAVNGPGGYFGRSWEGFDDCLFSGFGLETPCTIVWQDSDFSRRAMGDEGGSSLFDEVVDCIRSVPGRRESGPNCERVDPSDLEPWTIHLELR